MKIGFFFNPLLALISILLAVSSADAAWYSLSSLWQKSEISVCWADAMPTDLCMDEQTVQILSASDAVPTTQTLRAEIKNLVNAEYSKKKTGIHFVGWVSCEVLPNADAKIVFLRNPWHTSVSAIGTCSDLRRGHIPGRAHVTIAVGHDRYRTQSVVLHEFGHLAGLLHEDGAVIQLKGKADFKNFGGNDPFSVMSYEFGKLRLSSVIPTQSIDQKYYIGDANVAFVKKGTDGQNYLETRVGLSSRDVRTLRQIYTDK